MTLENSPDSDETLILSPAFSREQDDCEGETGQGIPALPAKLARPILTHHYHRVMQGKKLGELGNWAFPSAPSEPHEFTFRAGASKRKDDFEFLVAWSSGGSSTRSSLFVSRHLHLTNALPKIIEAAVPEPLRALVHGEALSTKKLALKKLPPTCPYTTKAFDVRHELVHSKWARRPLREVVDHGGWHATNRSIDSHAAFLSVSST